MWLGLVALAGYAMGYARRNRDRPLIFIELSMVFYLVFFCLPILFIDNQLYYTTIREVAGVSYGLLIPTIDLETTGPIILGILALIGGHWLAEQVFPKIRLPERLLRPLGSADETALSALAVLICLTHLTAVVFPGLASAVFLSQLTDPLGLFGFGLAMALLLGKRLRREAGVVIFGLLLPLRIVLQLYTGLLTGAVLLLLCLAAFRCLYRPKYLAAVGLIGLLIGGGLFFIKPGLDEFRRVAWHDQAVDDAAGTIDEISRLTVLLVDAIANPKLAQTSIKYFERRIAVQFATFCKVTSMTGTEVPFWDGTSYRNLLSNHLPRFLWRDKPLEKLGQEHGRRYRLIYPDDQVTSWNLPWLTEFYVNFGSLGIGFGMFLVGVFLWLCDGLLNGHDGYPVAVAIAVAVLIPLTYPDSNLSLMTGSIPAKTVALYCIAAAFIAVWHRVIRRRPQ